MPAFMFVKPVGDVLISRLLRMGDASIGLPCDTKCFLIFFRDSSESKFEA